MKLLDTIVYWNTLLNNNDYLSPNSTDSYCDITLMSQSSQIVTYRKQKN